MKMVNGKMVRSPDTTTSWWERQTWKQLMIGVLIVVSVAISWTGATQFRKSALIQPNIFYAPYFMVWFSTGFMTLCYPVYLIYALALNYLRTDDTKISLKEIHNEAALVFGEAGFTFKALMIRVSPFTALWIAAIYTYNQALGHISAGATTAIFSSNPAFVCIFGWLILRDKFVPFRVHCRYHARDCGHCADGLWLWFKGFTIVGIALAAVASVVAALYKVGFKKVIGNASLGQVSIFMTALGVQNTILNSFPTAVLMFFKLEMIEWTQVPWLTITCAALLSLTFNFLVNFGIVHTHPLFISIGLFLGMPLSAGFDLLFRNITMSAFMLIGSVLILTSFLILLIPTDWRKHSKESPLETTAENKKLFVAGE